MLSVGWPSYVGIQQLKIALIAPPFIAVPPADYGGTELFLAHLAEGLQQLGLEVVVYTNRESTVKAERRWIYGHSDWPIKNPEHAFVQDLNHEAWAVHDATEHCDIIHVQSAPAITFSRFIERPIVLTLHGPHDSKLSAFYAFYPEVHYVCISGAQSKQESMPRMSTVHHGIDLTQYKLVEHKQPYLSFIGRIAPLKGTHIAIDVAQRTGIPLKIAGDVQPMYHEYFERKVKPQIDGKLVDYMGLADLQRRMNCSATRWPAVPDPMERTLWAGHARSHGLWYTCARDARRIGTRGGPRRDLRSHLPLGPANGQARSRSELQPTSYSPVCGRQFFNRTNGQRIRESLRRHTTGSRCPENRVNVRIVQAGVAPPS